MALNRRTQLLLDEDRYERLREQAHRRGISMGALIREAIDGKLPGLGDERASAIEDLLGAEPMPVDDWPRMKRELIAGMRSGAHDPARS
jgi:hypothetical protein